MRKSISFSPFTKKNPRGKNPSVAPRTDPALRKPKTAEPCTEVSASDSEPLEVASRLDSSWFFDQKNVRRSCFLSPKTH